jgi:hypothetical protein
LCSAAVALIRHALRRRFVSQEMPIGKPPQETPSFRKILRGESQQQQRMRAVLFISKSNKFLPTAVVKVAFSLFSSFGGWGCRNQVKVAKEEDSCSTLGCSTPTLDFFLH